MSTWQVAFTPQINALDQKTARLDEKEDKNRASAEMKNASKPNGSLYRVGSIQAKPAFTNRKSRVSKSSGVEV